MNALEVLFDPLFRVPFLTGLLLAPAAAVVGAYLRLREEWLAALAWTQVAAAGAVLAAAAHLPVLPGAIALALLAAGIKGLLRRVGNDHFALVMGLSWGVTLLAAGRCPHGEHMARALLDGQLYFVGGDHLLAAVALLVLGGAALVGLSRRLLLTRLFPDLFPASGLPGRAHLVAFDLLAVVAIALATMAVGVMATFMLVLVPPWVAWRHAVGWRAVLIMSALLATAAYLLAFVLALLVDQPFGPVLVVVLAAQAAARWLPVRRAATT